MNIFKKERFSIRKLSFGAASVLIGASLFTSGVKAADENGTSKNVEVHYVAENDLTAEEKAMLKHFSDNQKVSEDVEAYYYVYKKDAINKSILPNTSSSPLKGVALAGTSLIVLALFVSKRRNKILTVSAFAVGLSGILGSTVLANEDFQRFFENVEVSVGGELPTPKNIEGYTFTGYYFTKNKSTNDEVKPTDDNKPVTPDKPADDNKPVTPDKPTDGNKPVTPDKPSDDNKPVIPDKPTNNEAVNTLDPQDEKENGTAKNPEVQVRENSKTTEIPFETVTKEDPTLKKGETIVKEEGKNGAKVETTREFYIVENGVEEVVHRDVVSTKETPAQNKVVLVGTKESSDGDDKPVTPDKPIDDNKPVIPDKPTNNEAVNTLDPQDEKENGTAKNPEVQVRENSKTTEIPFETVTKEDPTLKKGETIVKEEGKNGTKVETTREFYIVENGVEKIVYSAVVSTKETPAQNKVVLVGTKQTVTVKNIDFGTTYVADSNLDYGQEKIQDGESGLETTTTTYTVNKETGVVTPTSKTVQTKDPKNKVITKGTKTKVVETPIKFTTTYKADSTIAYNTKVTEVTGIDGKVVITTTYSLNEQTGEVTENTATKETPATNAIIKVGNVETKEEVLKATTEYVADTSLEYKKQAPTEGHDGKKVTTTTYQVDENGNLVKPTTTTQTTAAQNTVVKIGNVETTTTIIPIEEEKVNDPELDKGVEKERTPGKAGSTTVTKTYEVNPQNGELVNPQTATTTVPMEKRIIAVGTKENIEKKIDFNDVTKRELFLVNDKGEMEAVTGFSEIPTDTSKYILKLTRQNHKEVILPVSTITADGENFKVVSKGNEFLDDEGMTVDKIKVIPGTYTKFADLIAAIKKDPAGTYKLASDLVADDSLANSETSYIDNFTGTLESVDSSKLFAIKGLTRPLFNTLKNATIKNIKLDDLKVSTAKAASLALTTTGGTIENVHAKGDVTGTSTMAGLVLNATNTKINKVSVTGNLTLNAANVYSAVDITTGGIVGKITGGSLTKALVDANITTNIPNMMTNKVVGAVVGLSSGATLSELVAKGTQSGTINNTYGNAMLGGVIGRVGFYESANNIISYLKSENGDKLYGANATYTLMTNLYTVVGVTTGKTNNVTTATELTKDAADAMANSWDILPTESSSSNNSGSSNNQSSSQSDTPLDYTTVENAKTNKKVAYENISKLLPFYDAKTIVKYGNKVSDTDKLATTKIISVITMKDETPTNITSINKEKINKILVHYEDGTIQKLAITPVGFFKDTKVYEYNLGDGLLFTPEQFVIDRQSVVSELAKDYKTIDFNSEGMQKTVNLAEAQKTTSALKMDDLFWKSTFNDVKENIATILDELLSSDDVLGESTAINSTIKEKLSKDKEKILTGLSYISRLYDIHYGDFSIKNILLYHPEFYGNKKDLLEWLTSFSNLSFKELQVYKNDTTYAKQVAPITGSDDVTKFLEKNKNLFAPEKNIKEWYKESTKASVYEIASEKRSDADVSLYTWLNSYNEYKAYLLPLLNLRDNSTYIATNMSFITFGLKDRHLEDPTIKTTNPTKYNEEIAKVEESVETNAKRWAKFVDMWYGIVADDVKDKMIRPYVSVWGGFQLGRGETKDSSTWISAYDTTYKAMEDFFGSMGDYYGWSGKPASASNSDFQVSNNVWKHRSKIEFVQNDLLSDAGATTLSHEFVHAMDQVSLLDGYKRRPGQDAESYAYGLLESSYSPDDKYYAMNFIQDFAGKLATHNQNNERFTSADDLGSYMKGVYDVTYMLDAIEAENILKLPKADQKLFFDKLVPKYQSMSSDGVMNNDDEIRTITDSEWNSMTINSINDLIDNNLVAYDSNAYINKVYVQTDVQNYYTISLASPIYAGFQSSFGTSSGLLFRKMSLDVLAAKGWKEGFIPFATSQLATQATADSKVLSDEYAFKVVMGDQNLTYAQFKKNMYKQHLDDAKTNKFKAITIELDDGKHTITTYDDLNKLMNDAIAADVKRSKDMNNRIYVQQQSREKLKLAIIKAYHKETNDFRTSIYK